MLPTLFAAPHRVVGQESAAQPAGLEDVGRLNEEIAKLRAEGRYDAALPLAERVLAAQEKALGPDHPDVAEALYNLAALYKATGEYARAEPLYQRALSLAEKVLGPEHQIVGVMLNNLAGLYTAKGDYARAEPLYGRALVIGEKTLGADHPSVGITLNNLAGLYDAQGEYARAEPLYQRSLAIQEKAFGPEHPNVGAMLGNLAALYVSKGDYARAEPLYLRSLAITEKALGPDHSGVSATLNNLAALYVAKGDLARAEPLYLRSLAVKEKALGPDHPDVGIMLNNLAALYGEKSDYARAEPLYRRSLAIKEKALGPEHPDVAATLNNLAALYVAQGDYARAEPLYRRSLAVKEKALGVNHPNVAATLSNLAALYVAQGDYSRAVRILSRGNEVRERNLSLIIATGSERQKSAYLATLSGNTDFTVSLHARSAPSDPQALMLALTTVLRRKGRALDAATDQVAALRGRLSPQDRTLLDQLTAAQSQLSSLVISGPGEATAAEYNATTSRLEGEIERLQDAVGRRSAEFRAQTGTVTLEQVRRALPGGAALAEFFFYQPFDAKAKTPAGQYRAPRYVAYVLRKDGDPQWADLGEAAGIDAEVSQLLAALKCPQTGKSVAQCPDVKRPARAVHERVMGPVRRLLGGEQKIFISPDGSLNLVPFAALVDERGSYLVQNYTLTYLTSGRDLIRLQVATESRQPPLVMADPAFGPAASTAPGSEEEPGRGSGDMRRLSFGRLKGTAEEADALRATLPAARVLTQEQATEAALKAAGGPSVLHIATHGFFLSDRVLEVKGETRGITLASVVSARDSTRIANPLLRSGLALEGANGRRGAGGEDGILTALEVAGLDLRGTKLVVLSACETGVGEIRVGEGVYGLRRALVLAGSESQIMSLWQVSDAATRDLMVSYYKRLMTGEGRSEALRQVQLEMIGGTEKGAGGQRRGLNLESKVTPAQRRGRSHPYYWAAFIQSGDWRSMPPPPILNQVP